MSLNLKVYKIIGWLLLLLVPTACLSTGTVDKPDQADEYQPHVVLKISGSGSATAVLQAVKPAFEANTPGYRLEVLTGSSTGGGVQGIIQGVLDVAAMDRPLQAEEAARNAQYVEFGQGGVAIYVHPAVGLTDLTTAQVQAIFSGKIANWAEVGGTNEPIILYSRNQDDSSAKVIRQTVLENIPFPEKTAQVLTSQGDMLIAVAGTPYSLGFGSWPTAWVMQAEVQAITLDGLGPNDPDYPMTTPLGLGYLARRQAEIQPLIDWLRSEPGQAVLRAYQVIIKE